MISRGPGTSPRGGKPWCYVASIAEGEVSGLHVQCWYDQNIKFAAKETSDE